MEKNLVSGLLRLAGRTAGLGARRRARLKPDWLSALGAFSADFLLLVLGARSPPLCVFTRRRCRGSLQALVLRYFFVLFCFFLLDAAAVTPLAAAPLRFGGRVPIPVTDLHMESVKCWRRCGTIR